MIERETDISKRTHLLKKAELFLVQEMPVIPLFNHTYHYLVKDNVKNLIISNSGYVDLTQAFFEPNTKNGRIFNAI